MQQNIGFLLSDNKAFKSWLKHCLPMRQFNRRLSASCPIASFLRDYGFGLPLVGPNDFSYTYNYINWTQTTPEWARSFINKIDMSHGSITAAQCLALLS